MTVPRQNGKNALIEMTELYYTVELSLRILHTAHEVKTARKAFLRVASFFENPKKYPELADMVQEIRRTNGQEAIVLNNGGSIEFAARSKSSGRGFSVDVLILDEVQECTSEAIAALLPTISASPMPQQILVGTVPGPSANGEVFEGLRNDAFEGNNPRLSWMEWSADKDADLDDIGTWLDANPAAGIRLLLDTIRDERSVMDDETFMRERLGIWDAVVSNAVIDATSWGLVADGASQAGDQLAFAVDISPDRSMASVAVAGARPDGLYHVEVIENRQGTDWVIPYLAALVAQWGPVAVVVDGPASSLIPELSGLEVPVHKLSPAEFGAACGLFYDSVMNAALRHPNQPLFNTAVEAARKRPIGDMWGWGRKNATSDITPVVAATLALYGFVTGKPVKRKKRTRKAMVLG
ncbi:hypothetical protein [Nocardia terpenica]|uniref:Terminase n=1 Tax=Nocardia terpenica TaxID=455432 RepID=A0A291RT50_9NOCA|nr:hypothetical protein [Nocardia terpenica]ATL70771.1 hypothetical protein CRH09_35910 [Nocardia terpenica]